MLSVRILNEHPAPFPFFENLENLKEFDTTDQYPRGPWS